MSNANTNNKIIRKNGRMTRLVTIYIVRIALMSAMLTAVKFALSFVPNVEAVTLLIMVYASAFGIAYALPSALIFCAVEVAIYGVGSWALLYFVYWPLLALISSALLRRRRPLTAIAIAVIASCLFGVLSACCDTLFCVANLTGSQLAEYWVAYYLRGVYFNVVHIVSNAIVIAVAFAPLLTVLKKLAPDVYSARSAGFAKLFKYDCEYEREPFGLRDSSVEQ